MLDNIITGGPYSGSMYNLTPDRLGVGWYIESEYEPSVTNMYQQLDYKFGRSWLRQVKLFGIACSRD